MKRTEAVSHRLLLFVPLLALACGGDGGSTGPTRNTPRLAEIRLTPTASALNSWGATVQLQASGINTAGQPTTLPALGWSSSDAAIAEVDDQGLVTARGQGNATIRATAGSVSGSAQLDVDLALFIATVTPAQVVPGEIVAIEGRGFDAAGGLVAAVDGEAVPIESQTDTRVTLRIPDVSCRPRGNSAIQVRAAELRSNPGEVFVDAPGTVVDPAPGTLAIYRGAEMGCLQFAENAGEDEYIVGVQFINEDPGQTRSVLLGQRATGVAARLGPAPGAASARISSASRQEPEQERMRRIAEAELRERERQWFEPLWRELAPALRTRPARAAARAPLTVGESFAVRVPNFEGNTCTDYTEITTQVLAASDEVAWLWDSSNVGGLTVDEIRAAHNLFGREVYNRLVTQFGEPTDQDGNGQVLMVLTDDVTAEGIAAFVVFADLLPRSSCPSSGHGEYFYMKHTFGAGAIHNTVRVAAHETTHIIQFGRRFFTPGANSFQSTWEIEGQAELAEEVTGFDVTNHVARSNYDLGMIQNAAAVWSYRSLFSGLASLFGLNSSRNTNAPHECTWLTYSGNVEQPCDGSLPYGGGWAFLRWLTDRAVINGVMTEAEFHDALITDTEFGFTTVERVTGESAPDLLAAWAAALYVDERLADPPTDLRFASWDLQSVMPDFGFTGQLRPQQLALTPAQAQFTVRAASTLYLQLARDGDRATALRLTDAAGMRLPPEIQVWVVRLK